MMSDEVDGADKPAGLPGMLRNLPELAKAAGITPSEAMLAFAQSCDDFQYIPGGEFFAIPTASFPSESVVLPDAAYKFSPSENGDQ